MPPALVPIWLQAQQTYLRQDYATAYPLLVQLIPAKLDAPEQAEILGQMADCLQRLGRTQEAVSVLEELANEAPTSSALLQGMPWRYEYYLATGATTKADALWQQAITEWRYSPFVWDMIGVRLAYQARTAPKELAATAELIVSLPFTPKALTVAVYRPLLKAGYSAEALLMKQQMNALLTRRDPTKAELAAQAYDEAWTRAFVESLIQPCREAIEAGNLEQARLWLDHINTMIPEYPQAAEMRALYNTKVKEQRKD